VQFYTRRAYPCGGLEKGLTAALCVTAAIGRSTKEFYHEKIYRAGACCRLTALLLGGCAYRGHDRVGVSVGRGDYYNGYYDGSYGAFNDGYWGNDGAFYYTDGERIWHRDDGNHFRRDTGDGNT
jgi:hypothetical protein